VHHSDTISLSDARPFRWAVLGGVWLLYFSFGLNVTAMAPLLQFVREDLGLDNAQLGLILGAWPLIYIASAIPCGTLLDRLGPGRALLIGTAVIAGSGLLRGNAEGPISLFVAVAVFGIGGPVISVGAPKLVSLWFPSRERGLAMGIYVTGANLGAVTSLALANSVMMPLVGYEWRSVLFAYAGFALACGAMWFLIGTHPACRAMEKDIAAEPRISQLEQIRAMLRVPGLHFVLFIGMGIFLFNHGLGNWLPEILRTGGMTPAEAGLWAAIPTAIGIVAALTVPRLASESRRIQVLGFTFLSGATATLLLRADPGVLLLSGLVLQGIARGAMTATTMLLLIELPGIGSRNAGVAGGMFFSAAEIGGVMGPAMIGYLSHATGGFSVPLGVLTAGMLVLLCLLIPLKKAVRGTARP
jgi:CP family cyanate transporter-like MFS transporter